MLRYRSYSVDFLRKPKVMLEDDEIKSINDLMDKRATDEECRLTSEIYKSAFAKIQKGLEDENYFDVICLSQSIMNERLGKLLQTFQGIEDKFKLMTGLEETISNLLSFMDLQKIEIDAELNVETSEAIETEFDQMPAYRESLKDSVVTSVESNPSPSQPKRRAKSTIETRNQERDAKLSLDQRKHLQLVMMEIKVAHPDKSAAEIKSEALDKLDELHRKFSPKKGR